MKNKFTKLICLYLIVICCFAFCGCAEVDYGLQIYSNGIIKETVNVELSTSTLQSKGYDSEDVIREIISVSNSTINPYINNFISANLFRNKSTETGLNFYSITVNQRTSISGIPYNQTVIVYMIKYSSTEANISLQYYAPSIYYEFYGVTQQELDEMESADIVEDNFLYTKTITPGNTVFNDIATSNITTHFIQYFTEDETDNFNLDNVTFNYMYATYDSGLKSNCDYKDYNDNLTYHVWEVNSSNLNRETMFYKIQIKPVYWYLIALALTVVFIAILFFVNFVNNKRKSKIKNIINEKGLL